MIIIIIIIIIIILNGYVAKILRSQNIMFLYMVTKP